MSYQSVITLVERAFVSHLGNQSWLVSNGLNVDDSFGHPAASWPWIFVSCKSTAEQPEQSGNFMASVELLIVGRLDPDNASTYADNVNDHRDRVGLLHNYITATLTPGGLEGALSGYSNGLKVYDIRLAGSEREINTAEGTLEDVFNLEVYCKEV